MIWFEPVINFTKQKSFHSILSVYGWVQIGFDMQKERLADCMSAFADSFGALIDSEPNVSADSFRARMISGPNVGADSFGARLFSGPNVGADSFRARMISGPNVGADSLDWAQMISDPNASQFGLEYSSRSVVLIPARFTLHKKELGPVCICRATTGKRCPEACQKD